MRLFLIAYKSPQSDEKLKCNKSFVLYRGILFTGKTLAPTSSSCSLPDLHILMQKCMHIVCKWLKLTLIAKKKKKTLTVGYHWCIFQSELIHTTGLWIADSSRYLACQIFPRCRRRIGDDIRLRLWSFTLRDCHSRERAPICLRCWAFVGDLSKPVGEWIIRAKIVQCELGIRESKEKSLHWPLSAVRANVQQ